MDLTDQLPFKKSITDLEWNGKKSDDTYCGSGNWSLVITVKDAEDTPNTCDSGTSDPDDEDNLTIVDNM